MRAQTGIQSIPGPPRIREAKLLLVGNENDFKGGVTGDMLGGKRSYVAGKSTTLLGALARLHSEAIDVVLLSHTFREEELALFTADARRSGFHGLILRVASLEKHTASGAISFTDKQRTVLACVSDGWTNQQIARNMKCTEAAIKAIIQELFRKLEVRKRAQIVRVAIERQLIQIASNSVAKANEATADGKAFTLGAPLKEQPPLHVGDFIIDVATHHAWVRGVEIRLTPSEFQLLWILATHSGKLVKSSTLREMFWRN
jgi:DNA-binding CsgD family transcriptional regulator